MFEATLPTGHLYRHWGAEVPDGWLLADGRYIGRKTPGAKALYFLLWEYSEKMGNQFNKGKDAQADYDADKAIKIPDLREATGNCKPLIKL